MYKNLTRQEGGGVMSKYNFDVKRSRIKEAFKNKSARVHFVGVGGVGMYSLFKLTEMRGVSVSGSDREMSPLTERLLSQGKRVSIGHRRENAVSASLIVYTLAVSNDNPELIYAKENSIPTVSRAEYLGALMEEYKERIGVSGTHGKSTTTAMIDAIFHAAEKEPTTVLGATVPGSEEPLRVGSADYFIYEACEYKDSFLKFSPTASVFTNLELDHVDYFKDIDSMSDSFLRAMDSSPLSVVNYDDENLRSLIGRTKSRCVSYGTGEGADYHVCITGMEGGFYRFKIRHEGYDKVEIFLKVPGRFNVMNAVAAAVLCLEYGISKECIESSLSSFCGVGRRLEQVGQYLGAQIYYDYAHHPTEIECSIRAVRELHPGRLAVIFKPHTYSRTAAFIDNFASSLSLADRVFVCEVSGVREDNTLGISAELLVSKIGNRAKYISDEEGVSNILGDGFNSIIIMGAANLDAVKSSFLGK